MKDHLNHFKMTNNKNNFKGMTLIEVVIAIALSGFILTATASYVVSISDIWAKKERNYAFHEHADGVTFFIKNSFFFSTSEHQYVESLNELNINREESIKDEDKNLSVSWQYPIGFNDSSDPLLYWHLNKETPLLQTEDTIFPFEKSVYLLFSEDEGLSLLHYTSIQEELESENDLKRTLLSSYVNKLEYIYWDQDSEIWETEVTPKEAINESNYIIPDLIKLTFTKNEYSLIRIIPIPKISQFTLLY